jgi:hypothetical protein
MRFRTELGKGNEFNLLEVEESELHAKKGSRKGTKKHSRNNGTDVPVIETEDDANLKGGESKKSGFNVEFSDREQKKADGTLLRSNFIDGGAIIIYKSHPDFEERVKRTYQGDLKVTERLVSYLASEIAIQYKDKFFAVRAKQPEVQAILNSRKDSFIDLIDFSYEFEQLLQPFVGKNLLTLEAMGEDDNAE